MKFNKMLTFATIALLSALSTPNIVLAEETQKELNIQGPLVCSFSRTGAYVAFVSVVDNSSGDSYSISEPSEELKKNCLSEDIDRSKFEVHGSLTPRFLLWGNNLKVSYFRKSN